MMKLKQKFEKNTEENKEEKKNSLSGKQIIIIASVTLVAAVAILIIGFCFGEQIKQTNVKEDKEISDELTRTKCFISDWYAELYEEYGNNYTVFLNELSFANEYSLTCAPYRIRAVYPRGERFFKLEYITNIEFFVVDSKVRCRLYYAENGRYTFTV